MHLGFLRPLYDEVGDYVSVYLDTDRAHENALPAIELRWRAARQRLAKAGASQASLNAAAAVAGGPSGARGYAVFARHGVLAFAGSLDAPPRREIARLAPLPHLMPLLAQRRPPIPHVRVSATRVGGEIVAIGGSGAGWRDWFAGQQWPVHKTSVGGWSQDRYQRSVEETWAENAKALAAEVTAAAGRIGAQHVIVSGDLRARSLLLEHLATPLRESAAVLKEEVSADSPAMTEAADRALSEWAGRRSRERFDDWRTRLAHGLAVEGLGRTMAAFRDGQVSDLFLADDPYLHRVRVDRPGRLRPRGLRRGTAGTGRAQAGRRPGRRGHRPGDRPHRRRAALPARGPGGKRGPGGVRRRRPPAGRGVRHAPFLAGQRLTR